MAMSARCGILPVALLSLFAVTSVGTQKLGSRDDAFIGYSEKEKIDCSDKERYHEAPHGYVHMC